MPTLLSTNMKEIVIIGSGNVADALAHAITASNYTLRQIFARNRTEGRAIADAVGCDYASEPAALAEADIYLIAVSDQAIGRVTEGLHFGNDAVVAHTAGSVGLDELPRQIKNRAAFYPLQTFTKGRRVNFRDIPLFIECSSPFAVKVITDLANALSDHVRKVTSVQRMQLHMAAIFACNFSNHMYTIAQSLLAENGLQTDIIKPLIAETAAKAMESPSAATVQTGPAVRNDYQIKDKHMEMLKNHPHFQNLYKTISLNIWETSKKI